MRVSELDEVEKRVLLGVVIDRARADLNGGQPLTEMSARPGDLVQRFWCRECRAWHKASVLGGAVNHNNSK